MSYCPENEEKAERRKAKGNGTFELELSCGACTSEKKDEKVIAVLEGASTFVSTDNEADGC